MLYTNRVSTLKHNFLGNTTDNLLLVNSGFSPAKYEMVKSHKNARMKKPPIYLLPHQSTLYTLDLLLRALFDELNDWPISRQL